MRLMTLSIYVRRIFEILIALAYVVIDRNGGSFWLAGWLALRYELLVC